MIPRVCRRIFLLSVCCTTASVLAADRPAFFSLVEPGDSSAIVVSGSSPGAVEAMAVAQFLAGVQRDSDTLLTVSHTLPSGSSAVVVIGTAAGNPVMASLVSQFALPLASLPAEGFILRTVSDQNRKYLLIAGKDERGVLYGVQEAIDQVVTSTATGQAYVTSCNVQASTSLRARGTYSLTCWGMAPRFDRLHWEKAIDSMSQAGMNRIMFWMDGLFRSRRYPYAFLDQSYFAGVQLTDEDIHHLIQYAHDRGMEFLFGSGVFGWFTSNTFATRFPDTADDTGQNLDPSDAQAQQLTRDYLEEMIEVFPEADGYMLEIRDEFGDCLESVCQTALDPYGSKQYGQSELNLLNSLTQAVWQHSPAAKFVWLMGYANHNSDRLYYDRIRTMSQDPRLEWMEVRGSWTLPAMNGTRQPLTYFSNRISHWDPYYTLSPSSMQSVVQQTLGAGLYGYLVAYEPGFATYSIYGDTFVPFPVDQIPYVLTQFYYRSYTWNSGISPAALGDRAYQKFFTAEAPRSLADDLLYLRDFDQAHYAVFTGVALLGSLRQPSLAAAVDDVWNNPNMTDKQYWLSRLGDEVRMLQTLAAGNGDMIRVNQIADRIASLRPSASRRTLSTLDLMQRHIDDIHSLLQSDPDLQTADLTLYRIDELIAQYLGQPPPPAPFVIMYVEPGSPSTRRDGAVYGLNPAFAEPLGAFGFTGRYNGSVAWLVSKFRLDHFLPSGILPVQIASAKLLIPQTDVLWSGDPFTSMDLVLHHFATSNADTITTADSHGTTPALTNYGKVIPRHSRLVQNGNSILVDVTSAIRDDLARGRTVSSFRLGADPAGSLNGIDLTYLATADNTDPAFGSVSDYAFRNVMRVLIHTRDCSSGNDTDSDGVRDGCDDCPGTPAGVPVDAFGCSNAARADADGDGDVDQSDFGFFQRCLTGPFPDPVFGPCERMDLTSDDRIDGFDLAILMRCLGGADLPPPPGC